MAKLSLSVTHQLGEQEAVERLTTYVDRARAEYQEHVSGLQTAWNGNALAFQFSVLGFPVHGDLTVAPTRVRVDSVLPLAAAMFKGTVAKSIREELAKVLA